MLKFAFLEVELISFYVISYLVCKNSVFASPLLNDIAVLLQSCKHFKKKLRSRVIQRIAGILTKSEWRTELERTITKRKKENVNMHNACRSAKLLFGSVVGKRCAGAALSKHCMELFDSIDSLLDSSNGLTFLTKNSLKKRF